MRRTLISMGICAGMIILAGGIGNTNDITKNSDSLYVADAYNHVICKVNKVTGDVAVFAGTFGQAGSADGSGTSAGFNYPNGIASDGSNLYVSDTLNHTIRVISKKTGMVSTIAGTAGQAGYADGTGSSARFNNPNGIVCVGKKLYVIDTNNQTVRAIVIATGVVSTLAGKSGLTGSADGKGNAAMFNYPNSITCDGKILYISDTNNYTIRTVNLKTGDVATLAGTAGRPGATNDIGAAAEFNIPIGVAIDRGNLYVADGGNNSIRVVVVSTGRVDTFAGSDGSPGMIDGKGTAARFIVPEGIVCDAGNLYVTGRGIEQLRKITLISAVVTTLQGKYR
jgi:hypothetical protein